MKLLSHLLFVSALITLTIITVHAATGGEGVAVGSSDLIGTLQYSDSFTIGSGSTGSRNGDTYPAQDYPLDANGHPDVSNVENTYGNSAESWNEYDFSIANDANYTDHSNASASFFQTYPGSSGAGSSTGFTQTGLDHADTVESSGMTSIDYTSDHGIAYGLGTNFVVQTDAVQTNDRIDINIGNTNDTVLSSDGLSVFFRASTATELPTIGLYSFTLGEIALPFVSTNVTENKWNNYAVGFNLNTDVLSIYTNEVLDGTVDLATFDSGAYKHVLDMDSADYVSIGGHVNPQDGKYGLLWTDNFEVGTPVVPEPSTWAMLLGGLGGLFGIGRLRRLNG